MALTHEDATPGATATLAPPVTAGPSAAQPLVVLAGVGRRYDEVEAVAGVDLTIDRGEQVWLVGPSGSGKSTLLRLLAGHVLPTAGTLVAGGLDLRARRSNPARWRAQVGFVHQDHGLLADRTAAENVAFALEPRGWRAAQVRERVDALLHAVGLAEFADRYPRQLSGGECQRVAVARALAAKPALLACDEPTGNLDPDTSLVVLRLLVEAARQGTAVVIASHDVLLVERFRARVVELEAGRVVRDDRSGRYRARADGAIRATRGRDEPQLPLIEAR